MYQKLRDVFQEADHLGREGRRGRLDEGGGEGEGEERGRKGREEERLSIGYKLGRVTVYNTMS